ncbi:MAG: DUF6531 domain-containing protein [Gaiellaceae bacterium]
MRAATRLRLPLATAVGLVTLFCLLASASSASGGNVAPYLDPAYASKLLQLVQDQPAWQDAVTNGSNQDIQDQLGKVRLAAIRASLPAPKDLLRNWMNSTVHGQLTIKPDVSDSWSWAMVDGSQSDYPHYVITMDGFLGTVAPFTTGHARPGIAYWQYDAQGRLSFSDPPNQGLTTTVNDGNPTWALTFAGTDDSVDYNSFAASLLLDPCPACYAMGSFMGAMSERQQELAGMGTLSSWPTAYWCSSGQIYPWIGPFPAWGFPCSGTPYTQTWNAVWLDGSAIANDPVTVGSRLPFDGHSSYYDQFSASAGAALSWNLDAARSAIGADGNTTTWVNCELTQGPTSSVCKPPTFTLSAPSPSYKLLTNRTVTFDVNVDYVKDPSGTVLTATITGANPQTLSATVQGTTATFSYTGTNTGTDTVQVSGALGGYTISSNKKLVSWVVPTLTLSQPSPDSDLVTGDEVSFDVEVGNVPDAKGSVLTATITGANPRTVSATVEGTTASFSYSGSHAGVDGVQVSGEFAGNHVSSNTVEVSWTALADWLEENFGLPGESLYLYSATTTWADPVNSATGNFYQSVTDISIPGAGIPFSLERTYNSRDDAVGVLDRGWSASLYASLSTDYRGNVTLKAGNGQEVRFGLRLDGSYVGDANVTARLTKAGSGYDLVLHDQDVQHFDSDGRLVSWLDPNGQGLHFSYAADGLLESVSDSAGRQIGLSYNEDHHLSRVSLPDGTTLAYGYDGDFLTTFTDQTGAVTRYVYDDNGFLKSATDGSGKLLFENTYDSEGRVLTQKDALGAESSFDWSGASAVATDATGSTWKDTYNDDGQLSKRIDPLGNDAHYVYDDANNLLSVTDPLGNTTTMTYDGRGNMLSRTDALGAAESWTYDSDNNVLSHTDQLGHVTRDTYDANGNLLTETDPTGAVTTYEYDSAGRLVSATDPLGRTTRDVYDDQGNLIATISPSGAKRTMSYDSLGRMVAETDPLGNTTTYIFDANGRPIKTTDPLGHSTISTYDDAGRLVAKTDANGNTTRYLYDEAGHQVAVIAPDGSITRSAYDSVDNLISTTDALGNKTTFEYDADGRQTAEISPTGERTTTTYDANGNRVASTDPLGNSTTTAYDALGHSISSTDPLGRTTKTVYDPAGNVVETTGPSGDKTASEYDAGGNLIKTTDPLGHSTTSTYDDAGQLVAKTDANGHTTHYAYDLDGRKVSVTAPDGSVTSYAYDADGNMLKRTDANGHVTTYRYDAAGDKTQVVNPLGSRSTYSYDANGNQIKTVTAIGNATTRAGDGEITMTYDSQERLMRKSYSDGTPSVSYSYDANGDKTQMTDGTGKTTYAYDRNGRLIAVSGSSGGFLYRYDEDGNLVSRTYPNGLETTYGYDSAGQMVDATVKGETTRYTYDALGNLASTLHPNGILDTRSYDAAERVTEISGKTKEGKPFYSRSYTYDPVGNPVTRTASSVRKDSSLGWWLKNWWRKDGALSKWAETYTYDSNDRLTEACMNTSCSRYFKYSYDPVGNRTQLQTRKGKTLYSYDAADELVNTSDGHHTLGRYSYDPNGNELFDGSTRYAYNLANELTQVIGEGKNASYTYTGDDLMATRSTRSDTTTYSWDTSSALGELALETDSRGWDKLMGKNAKAHTYGLDPLGIVTQGGSYTFHTDALGSVVELSDSRGKLVESYRYTPFGEAYGPGRSDEAAGDSLNPVRFTGQYLDSGSGLYDLRAREYDPELGRFFEVDPQEAGADGVYLGAYLYADDRPTVMTDPSGDKAVSTTSGLKTARIKAYINAYATSTNPFFGRIYHYHWYCLGLCGVCEDCTNFVSQVLYAGGWSLDNDWYFRAAPISTTSYPDMPYQVYSFSRAWTVVHDFIVHAIKSGRASVGSRALAATGDVVAVSGQPTAAPGPNYPAYHLMIVNYTSGSGKNKQIFVAAHCNDYLKRRLYEIPRNTSSVQKDIGNTGFMFLHMR